MSQSGRLLDAIRGKPVAEPTVKITSSGAEIHIPYAKGVLVLYQLRGSEYLFSGTFIFNEERGND